MQNCLFSHSLNQYKVIHFAFLYSYLAHWQVSEVLVQYAFTVLNVSVMCNSMGCISPGSSVQGDSPGKNTGVGCHVLLQGIFPTQGLNPGLPYCRWILYHLSHQGSPCIHCRSSNDLAAGKHRGAREKTGSRGTPWCIAFLQQSALGI